MPEPPATDAGAWLTLRELDDRGGAAKGTAFRAFRTALAELVEGRDFLRLDAVTDADTIATLRAAGRVYAGSVHVVLIRTDAAGRLGLTDG